jgi:tRNA nucleotidyltransferase (CCA-adding enzyme)
MTPAKHEDCYPVLDAIQRSMHSLGAQCYLVGGSVRDRLMGLQPKDYDVEVFGANPEAMESALSKIANFDRVGKAFGVWKIKGCPIDVSLPRVETRVGPKHTDFETEFDPKLPIEKAAMRRDFTINAIYQRLSDGKIIDPYQGHKDITAQRLRHVSDKFAEDPLRVYRAMQFIARFELDCDAKTLELCRSMNGDHLPKERVFEEFKKLLLEGQMISWGLEFLKKCGWIRYFPELEALIDCPQDPKWHPEGDVWNHTLLALDAFAHRRTEEPTEDLIVGLAVMCHDMGKPKTTVIHSDAIRSRGHDIEGVSIASEFLARITNEKQILEIVPLLVREHMNPFTLFKCNASDAAIKRIQLRTGGNLDKLMRVCQADREGRQHPWKPLPFEEGEWICKRLRMMGLENQIPEPLIQGRDLIELGMVAGPQMGVILKEIFEIQIDGGFSNKEEGLLIAKNLLKNRNLVTE